jgi:mono/diheme cytochrome c family protein
MFVANAAAATRESDDRHRRWTLLLLPAAAWLFLSACGGDASRPGSRAAEPAYISWTHYDVPPAPADPSGLVERGKQVYLENCAACHGENGAGDGVCSAFLIPAPRDFTRGVFRFKTTPGGEMPTDKDLFRTVSLGLHSTGMPPWKFLLPDEDRWAVVEYIKTFYPPFDNSDVTPVELGDEPTKITAADIENGKKIYAIAQCSKCHGEQGYGDGPSSLTLEDTFGKPIPPRNFHKLPHYKRGTTLRDIALTVHTGNNGTPMPSFDEAFKPDEIWDLAAYIQSLGEKRLSGGGDPAAAHEGTQLGTPDVVIKVMERHWKYVPDVIRVKKGQIVRIEFQPTDNGLGAGHGLAVDGYDKAVYINGAMVQRPKSATFRADKAGTFKFYCASQCSTGPLHPNMMGKLIVESDN